VCVATLKALPTNYDREVALGEIISTLKHVEMIKSLAAIYTQTLLLIDHYSNGTIEPRAY
jgi:hypothetical protein